MRGLRTSSRAACGGLAPRRDALLAGDLATPSQGVNIKDRWYWFREWESKDMKHRFRFLLVAVVLLVGGGVPPDPPPLLPPLVFVALSGVSVTADSLRSSASRSESAIATTPSHGTRLGVSGPVTCHRA